MARRQNASRAFERALLVLVCLLPLGGCSRRQTDAGPSIQFVKIPQAEQGGRPVLASKLVKNATLKVYPGGSHSLGDTSKEQLNADLLAFIRGEKGAAA